MASTAPQHSERGQQLLPLFPPMDPKAMKAMKASFKCWMQLAAAHAAGIMPAGMAFVPGPMAMGASALMLQQQLMPKRLPPSAPPPRPAPARPHPPCVESRAPAAVPAAPAGVRAGSSDRALPARKRPIEEMRKLQRVLLKLLPASECYNPEGVHLSQITVGGIRSYLDQTLGDAPAVAWHQDTYYSYLRRLFIWATGRSDITIQAAADCVWLKPGHGWVLREERLAELGVNWQQWQVPLRHDQVRDANSLLAPAEPEAAVQPQLQLQPAPDAAAPLPTPPSAADQQQEQQVVASAVVQHAPSPSAAAEQLAADCAATTTAACVQQGQQQLTEQAVSKRLAAGQEQEEQVQPMQVCQPATQGVQEAAAAAAAGPAAAAAEPQQQQLQQQGSQKRKAAAKQAAEDGSTSSSSSSSTSSSMPPAKRRAVQAAATGSSAGAAAAAGAKKQQVAAAPCNKIDPCVLAAARVIVSLKKAHSL